MEEVENKEIQETEQPDTRGTIDEARRNEPIEYPKYKEVDMKDVLMTSIAQMKRQAETCEAKASAFQEVIDFMVQYNVKAIAQIPMTEGGKRQ